MSKTTFCPVGGQQGILLTAEKLYSHNRNLGNKYADEEIPLPDGSSPKKSRNYCKHIKESVYWEIDTGKHGWACPDCGEVTQWG